MSQEIKEIAPGVRAHHKFGPSRMGYLDKCSGFTNREEQPDHVTEASEEGTFLHNVMDLMVRNVVAKKAKTVMEQISRLSEGTFEITEEQQALLRACARKLDRLFAMKPKEVLVEIQVQVARRDGKELNHGHLDLCMIFGAAAIIVDYKFGWIPVVPAQKNFQGKNYWAGIMQRFPALKWCGVCFIQPKLNVITEAQFKREELPAILEELEKIVDDAKAVQADPKNALRLLNVGPYCDWCALAGGCTALNNARGMAVSKHLGLPMPPKFEGLSLNRPQDLALAKYWVDIIEKGLGDVKERARECAELNGGSISCTLPSGEVITYEMTERSCDRKLGSAIEVAEALKEFVTPEEILGAAELAIGKLETVAKNAMVELAKARGEKLSKKAAWEQLSSTLTALGLLTRGEGKIRFLKQKKSVQQLEDKK